MIERKHKRLFTYFLSIITFFILWTLLAKSIDAPLILPSVGEVFVKIGEFIKTKSFWQNFSYTFLRVLLAFFISLVLGTFLGLLCGYSKTVKDFLDFPLTFVRSTPVVAIIIIMLFWFNSSSIPIIVAILMDLPIVVTSIAEGYSKDNKNLLYMAKVYKLSSFQVFRYIKLKAIKPFFFNSAVSVFGLSWKVVVAGEVISIPKYGFGSLIQISQVHLETSSVIAITLVLVLFSFIMERLFAYIVNLGLKNE